MSNSTACAEEPAVRLRDPLPLTSRCPACGHAVYSHTVDHCDICVLHARIAALEAS